ncbi:MAG TPA: autotransporter domain-containing protein, partial [Candidatus Binatia bacterium]
GSGGTGGNVTVSNEATITLNGGNSIGIMGQSIGGGGGTTKTFVVPVFGFELEPFKTTIGGSEGANGAGGDVTVTNSGTININGDNSVGIFAQSVGGGGGLVQLKGGAAQLSLADGGVGNGGTQTVTNTGDIFITGKNSVALFGQSIGGGGGAVIGDSPSGAASSVAGASSTASAAGPIFSGTSGGSGNAAPVVVNQTGHLVAMGENSTALVAQSDAPDGAGDITVNILNRSPGELSVIAGGSGSGAGVKILGGADNQLNNNGMITNVLGTDGNAILGDKGNNTVNNFGAVIGSVDLGTGAGAFNNSSGASFSPGATVNLSGGLLSNSGVFTPGGSGKTQTTALTGNLSQSGSGSYNVDLDVGSPSAASDRVNASGTADLAGQAVVNPTNTGFALPGSRQATIVSAAGGATDSGLTLTAPESAVIKYELLFPNATDAAVNFTVDFAPQGGLNGNQSAIGRYINRIQLAGGSDAFAPIAAALVGIPTVDGLASAYDGLSPEPFAVLGNTTWHSNQQFGNALLSCRARDGDFRFVREDECGWMTFGGGASHQDRTSSNIGYNRNAFIAAGGLQKAIGGSNWRAGIGFGYESNWLTVPDIARSEGHQAQGGLTLKGRWGGTTLAFAATGGHGWFESSRSVSLGVGTAKSDPHLSFGSFQVQLGHSFERAAWYLRPLVNSAVNYVHLHSFSEHGAGGANLRVRSDDEAFVTLGPALEMGGEIKLDYGILIRPFTRLGFSRLLSGVNPGVTASFQGAPAGVAPVTVRNENDRNFGEVSLGVDVLNVKGLDIRAGYNGQFSKHSESHGGNLKLSIPF